MTIHIDGRPVATHDGQSILEAALAADIYIPHLCTHPSLPVLGECGLCVVEANGALVKACETKAVDGMSISLKSERALHQRNVALEFLLASHPHDCSSCKAYLKCELQAIMQYTGITHSRLRTILRRVARMQTINPLIVREMERCVQCGRCVRACKDLRGIGALAYNKLGDESYIGTIGDKPLAETDCRFCGACVEVCPTGALQDVEGVFRNDLPRAKALIPCQAECPAHVDIPAYIRAVSQGEYSEAVGIIREKVPFPLALGYICNNRCEPGCKRSGLNSPLSIRNLKRFAVEQDTLLTWKSRFTTSAKPRTGCSAAIIGAGPCGLTAAYYLNRCGHDVTVFEKRALAGGQMTSGIPAYRLPTDAVLSDLRHMEESGVNIVYEQEITNAATLKQSFDAVLVATGTGLGKKPLQVPGVHAKGVYTALELLCQIRQGTTPEIGETVCVVGGGNVAFDVAGSLIRLGKRVNVVCLEKDASQASAEERDQALSEGAALYDCHASDAIVEDDSGHVAALSVHKISGFHFDAETQALIEEPIPDSACELRCDAVVFAMGQLTGLSEDFGLALNRFGYPISPETGKSGYHCSIEGVFAAGDVITGTRFVIDAIAGAREVAVLMDRYLGGTGEIDDIPIERRRTPWLGKEDRFSTLERQIPLLRPAAERITDFRPVMHGLCSEQAGAEARRCLQCDLRNDIEPVRPWMDYSTK